MKDQKEVHVKFKKRSIPIAVEYRSMYKIGLIVLILYLTCRGNKASLNKIQFIYWSIRSITNAQKLKNWIAREFKSEFLFWGVDPAINKALVFAISDNIISLHSETYKLTDKGVILAKSIYNDSQIFEFEKPQLTEIGKNRVTEQIIHTLIQRLKK